jgi:hypothetical protein
MKEQLRNRAMGTKLQSVLEQVVADARKDIKVEVLLPPPADEPAATPKPLMIPGAPKPVDAPKADAPPADAPKADAPPAEAPKADAPPAEAPKAEAPPAEGAEKK